ncbi:glutamine-dependent NAD(+) synthetase-like isoform X1 [Palaemon carinicauda]|uniref:glutamine-dependent NAD(+) synthetase-like isoform X1 n=1 Tax=Palaemon carinicauda TaxID=392227 RepID=UPI0035B680B4
MGRVAVLATCSLNQLALDYEGNVERIIESVQRAKDAGARYLCGTELSITGYGCGDHYHERDTEMYAWEALATIMQDPVCSDIMVDVGLPVMHKNVIYNCKLVFLNRRVLLIRPKMMLANDSFMGYRETRWFTGWHKVRQVEDYLLPHVISEINGQRSVPFGDGIIATDDTTIGYDICEELWNPESCHLLQCLDGAEIISNGLGSAEEYGRPELGYQMVQMATMKSGGCYLFANQKGFDGSQGYYAGDSCIGLNGNIIAHTNIHTLEEVEVITASVDLEVIRRYKASIRSRCIQAAKSEPFPRIKVEFSIGDKNWWTSGVPPLAPLKPSIPAKEEQILKVPACWLWDYLRRSGQGGLLLPLSREEDSFATAAIVYSMCLLVVDAVAKGSEKVLADVRRVVGQSDYVPINAQELCGHILQTIYIEISPKDSDNSKLVTDLAREIGSIHLSVDLDNLMPATMMSFLSNIQFPTGPQSEELTTTASKNFQSRLSLVVAYYFAELGLSPGSQKKSLIVLGSSSADKHLTGSNVKYGRTFGDLNLVGSFSRRDILKFLQFASERLNLPTLRQLDIQEDASEQVACAYLQTTEGCGPSSMFQRLWYSHKKNSLPQEVAEKVKEYFHSYNDFRRNMFGLPLVCYMPSLGPPDDARPLVYPRTWAWQLRALNKTINDMQPAMGSSDVATNDSSK